MEKWGSYHICGTPVVFLERWPFLYPIRKAVEVEGGRYRETGYISQSLAKDMPFTVDHKLPCDM